MKPDRILLPLLVGLIFSSCVMTNQIRTLKIEILRPGIFNIPKDQSVVVINRDLYKTDTCTFRYSNGILKVEDSSNDLGSEENTSYYIEEVLYEIKKDTSIHYKALSDTCVQVLSDYFKTIGYFSDMVEQSDSIYQLISVPGKIESQDELFEQTKTDICIFLDFFQLRSTYSKDQSIPFRTKAKLLWTVVFKYDSLAYTYTQVDTLFYDRMQLLPFKGSNAKILSQLVNNSSIYLGNSFGAKMIPNWIQTERIYYKSQNTEMLKAEKYAISQDWLKAAEIWNQQSKNKNDKIAAKACYNMALACEMEGKPDVAIAWLVKSFSSLKKNNEDHKTNCQRYVNVLALRKLEIERLAEQVSQQEIDSEK